MQFIEAGLILSCLLALLAIGMLGKVPLNDRSKLYLIDRREFKGWGMLQNMVKFFLHTTAIICTYLLLGMTLTAHIAVIGFEVIWNYVATPLAARYLSNKIGKAPAHRIRQQPSGSLIPPSTV